MQPILEAASNQFHFDEIAGIYFRYIANSILNAGYIQFDNSFNDWLRIVWGARYEYFDQLIGSVYKSDPRYNYKKQGDLLPALNITFKLNNKTNLRVAASQTIVRPEFRELTGTAFYDFEVGATIIGNPNLVRTKITNADIRMKYTAVPVNCLLSVASINFFRALLNLLSTRQAPVVQVPLITWIMRTLPRRHMVQSLSSERSLTSGLHLSALPFRVISLTYTTG
jgi:hypothetical protein